MDSIGWAVALIPPLHAAAVTFPLIRSDLRERRLPNRLVLPFLATTLVSTLVASFLLEDWGRFSWALLSGALVFVGGCAIALKDYLGMGDVKLASGLGMALGWFDPVLPWMAFSGAFLLASLQILMQKYRGGRARTHTTLPPLPTIPFGPYLLAGFMVSIAWVSNREVPQVELLRWASHWQHIEQNIQLL